jgi:beta-lactamase regulating signal transducer with metallopeptidase domain
MMHMIPTLIEAALRALVVAFAVWAGLRLLRVGNVLAQKTAWGLVLAAALLMPLLMHRQWLPVNATVKLPVTAWPANDTQPAAAQDVKSGPVLNSNFDAAQNTAPVATANASQIDAASQPVAPAANASLFRFATFGWCLYLTVCAALLMRLLLGLGSAARLWLRAEPVALGPQINLAAGLRLRSSPRVATPVAVGSGVVLPADYAEWDAEKLRIVLAHERSHVRQGDFYLQLLAELYAALFWFSPLGWWLKRKLCDLGEAISDRAGLEAAASRASYAQILLEFAALPRLTLIQGVSMAHSSNLSHRIERLLNESSFRQAFANCRRRALLAVLLVPVALFAATAVIRVEAASSSQPATPQPAVLAQSPALEPASVRPIPEKVVLIAKAPVHPSLAAAAGWPMDAEATFERTLNVSGQVQLSVSTGSGNIHLTRGAGDKVHIAGKVKGGWGASEERVKEIAANPPIEQTGNIVRIGGHQENLHNISIDYEIQAPENVILEAGSGSGDITVEGVGENAKLNTGSGNIHATGLHNGFSAETGSGDIYAEQTGSGDVKAHTGSGNMELRNLHGGLRAGTGSGDIKVGGAPTTDWKLGTGSGNVELWPGSAGITLDASTGSGSIHCDHEIAMQGDLNRHHVTGKLNGGGPTVRIETGSGDIRIH